MLNDPLFLANVNPNNGAMRDPLASGFATLPRLDAPLRVTDLAPGKSVRVGVDNANLPGQTREFVIAHTDSKENAPYRTLRTNIRLNVNLVDGNGVPVHCAAQMTIIAPQGLVGHELLALNTARELAATVLFGPRLSAPGGSHLQNSMTDFLERVLAGEP